MKYIITLIYLIINILLTSNVDLKNPHPLYLQSNYYLRQRPFIERRYLLRRFDVGNVLNVFSHIKGYNELMKLPERSRRGTLNVAYYLKYRMGAEILEFEPRIRNIPVKGSDIINHRTTGVEPDMLIRWNNETYWVEVKSPKNPRNASFPLKRFLRPEDTGRPFDQVKRYLLAAQHYTEKKGIKVGVIVAFTTRLTNYPVGEIVPLNNNFYLLSVPDELLQDLDEGTRPTPLHRGLSLSYHCI